MNALPSPLAVLALQGTLLVALGWGLHGLMRHRHPRWRLLLWRSVLVLGLALPLVNLVRLPRWRIPTPRAVLVAPPAEAAGRAPGAHGAGGAGRAIPAPARETSAVASQADNAVAPTGGAAEARMAWWRVAAAVWLVGVVWEAIRLWRLQRQVRRIARGAQAASPAVQARARQIGGELRIRRAVDVRVSDEIASPFLCGVFAPAILIPRRLAENLTPAELGALLSHELAHERRHDLAWCLAWRGVKALCWFHPLVWKIPDAHVLACEEEADRVAAGRAYEGDGYAQILAQLALRILRGPAAESGVTLNATSHLARRLVQLGRARAAAWRWRHSVAGGAVVAGLLVLTAGWQFGQEAAAVGVAPAAAAPAAGEMAEVVVTVQDEAGRPIARATITPDGLRPAHKAGMASGHYMWRPENHGPATKVVTDGEGHATVRYPVAVVPAEKILTGEISFSVDHPDYAAARPTAFPVDERRQPVVLKRGIPIHVAGFFGEKHEPVTHLVPHLTGGQTEVRREDWQPDARGGLTWRRMSPGKHFLHLAGRSLSGEMVFSEGVAFFAEQRDGQDFMLEMKRGVRVEGRLDARVPRPVRNGWVQLAVHEDEADLREGQLQRMLPRGSGNTGFWWTYRPIAADGTFVFEAVPRGELKVIAYGEGFISKSDAEPAAPSFPGAPPQPPRPVTRAVPQSFAETEGVTDIEVVTEATATLTVVAKANGRPLAGAKVYLSPNMIQMPSGSRLFGAAGPSSESEFRADPRPSQPLFARQTDQNGVAVFANVPAFTSEIVADHPEYELPLLPSKNPTVPPRRRVEIALTPGKPARVEIALQVKGHEFVGGNH